jgi:hypothetical protein
MKKSLEVLDEQQRSGIGDVMVVVAAADGVISPEGVTSLTKIFTLLELDPDEVHTRMHAHLTRTGPAPASTPVTVRPGSEADPGFPIHAPAPRSRASSMQSPRPLAGPVVAGSTEAVRRPRSSPWTWLRWKRSSRSLPPCHRCSPRFSPTCPNPAPW